MKKFILNLKMFIIAMMVLASCSESEIQEIEITDPSSTILGSVQSTILGPVQQCDINPFYDDWDSNALIPGESATYGIWDNGYDQTTWTSSDESILKIVSGRNSLIVTVKAIREGKATLSFTGDIDDASGTCGNSGDICIDFNRDCDCTADPLPSDALFIGLEGCSTALARVLTFYQQSNVESIDWTWSLGSYNDISINSWSNVYNVVLDIPSGNWNNYDLVFKAVVHYDDCTPSSTHYVQKTLTGCGGPSF